MNRVTVLLLIVLSLLVVGCQVSKAEPTAVPEMAALPETAAPTESPAVEPTELASDVVAETTAELAGLLGNLTYSGVLPDQPITLTDGIANYEDENVGHPFVDLIDHLIPTGDLNGDGAEDAVAFLVDNTTGSADLVFLAAVLSVWADPMPAEAIMIGDRTPVRSLTIEGDQVFAEYIAPGPDDVACCPTRNVRKVFQLEAGRLVERSNVELGKASLVDLNGTSWQLADLDLEQEPVLPGTEITLRFDGGQISGSAGCNNYSSAALTGEDGLPQSLAVGPIASTQMLCADNVANQEAAYLDRLSKVVAWRYAFGNLSLTYKLENNTLGELLYAQQGL